MDTVTDPGTEPETGSNGGQDSAAPGRRRGGHRGQRGGGKTRKRLKWTAFGVAGSLVVLAGGAYGYLQYMNGKIRHQDLTADKNNRPPDAARDAKGRSPLNILLIGNDSRVGEGRKYGAEGHEGLADTTVLMHLSADRSNATLVSIPRDTMVDIPRCELGDGADKKVMPARFTMFNESFAEIGAPCTVATVERMLQVKINHFIEIDFKGVRKLTEAVDGVPICLESPINDPVIPGVGGTGLALAAGDQRLKGEDALKFLRTRHAFEGESDLSRIEAQKLFLMSLARELKSNAKLTNATELFKIANTAVDSLTVDHGLASVQKLLDLGEEIKRVPEKRMAFTTLPTEAYPMDLNRVQPKQPAAGELWASIRADRPLTGGGSGGAPATPSPTVTPPAATLSPAEAAKVRVTVDNGTAVRGRITPVVQKLTAQGYKAVTGSTMPDGRQHANSRVTYPAGDETQARAVAAAVGLPETALEAARPGETAIRITIGSDFPGLEGGGTASPSTSPTLKAEDLLLETADNRKCAAPGKK